MFCNCKNVPSQAWAAPEHSEASKNKVHTGMNVRNEQTAVKYHRIPFHRRNKDRNKPKKPKATLMNIRSTGILSDRNKENAPHPSVRDSTHSDASKSFSSAQWPQLRSPPPKSKKVPSNTKTELLSTETQTDVFNIAEMYPLWNTREIVSQISEDVSFLRQNRITQGTQTEDISILKENHPDSLAHLAGMLTLAQIHKTYADVVQQENGRIEQGMKCMNTEASTELKTFFKVKGTRRHNVSKHAHKSLEASPQKVQVHSFLVDVTEVQLSRNDKDNAADPHDFKSLLLMLSKQNGGLKIHQHRDNQPGLLYILNSPKYMAPEAHPSYDISASTRNYFILHSDSCMLNCATVDQLMYGYSFQEGNRRQIKLYNQSLQTKNTSTLTIIDTELQELSCRKTVGSSCQEVGKSEEQRFQQNGDINKSNDRAQANEDLQNPDTDTSVAYATEKEDRVHLQPEAIATEGLDPTMAFDIALDLWGGNKPRMSYTKMLRTHSLQNKFSAMPYEESAYGEADESCVPKWLIVPLQRDHRFLLDAASEEDQSNSCSIYYESQTCRSSRYTIEIQNRDYLDKQGHSQQV